MKRTLIVRRKSHCITPVISSERANTERAPVERPCVYQRELRVPTFLKVGLAGWPIQAFLWLEWGVPVSDRLAMFLCALERVSDVST